MSPLFGSRALDLLEAPDLLVGDAGAREDAHEAVEPRSPRFRLAIGAAETVTSPPTSRELLGGLVHERADRVEVRVADGDREGVSIVGVA